MSPSARLSLGQMAALACQLEVCAPKPGNVHRGADFEDVTLQDFLASSVAILPVFDRAGELPLGQLILESVEATAAVTSTNTNLGMVLLLAPLAKPQNSENLREAAQQVVEDSTEEDARSIYEAIRRARPGGMGQASQHDVAGPPPRHILEAMRLAAQRDGIARQYSDGFAEVFEVAVPLLASPDHAWLRLSDRIVYAHVRLMAEFPDTLIARKCGEPAALQSAALAQRALDAGPPDSPAYFDQLARLDFWLRSSGHRRNPGTTADLIAAALFVCLRQKLLVPPFI